MESIVFTRTVEEQVKARCLGRAVLREKQREQRTVLVGSCASQGGMCLEQELKIPEHEEFSGDMADAGHQAREDP